MRAVGIVPNLVVAENFAFVPGRERYRRNLPDSFSLSRVVFAVFTPLGLAFGAVFMALFSASPMFVCSLSCGLHHEARLSVRPSLRDSSMVIAC